MAFPCQDLRRYSLRNQGVQGEPSAATARIPCAHPPAGVVANYDLPMSNYEVLMGNYHLPMLNYDLPCAYFCCFEHIQVDHSSPFFESGES